MNKVLFSAYNTSQIVQNGESHFEEKRMEYDGNTLSLYKNKDGHVEYERLTNDEIKKLLNVGYKEHSKPLINRLSDDFIKSKRRKMTRKSKPKQRRSTISKSTSRQRLLKDLSKRNTKSKSRVRKSTIKKSATPSIMKTIY